MKRIFTFLLTIVASMTMAQAEILKKVQVGDLYYNLDTENRTAEIAAPVNNKMTEITIPTSVTYENVPYSVTGIGETAFYYCDSLLSIVIPEGILYLGEEAFCLCYRLESVFIPATVTRIGGNAFHTCLSLLSIDVSPDNTNYSSRDGVLFDKDQTKLIRYPAFKEGDYTIPGTVTSLEKEAFATSLLLTSVTIPNTVTRIPEGAFRECSRMAHIGFPEQLAEIEGWAFYGCRSLKSIDIPETVTSIGKVAFMSCDSITSMYIHAGITYLGDTEGDANGSAFSACHGLMAINVAPDNPNFCSIDGVLFSKDRKTLWQFPCGRKGGYSIPYGTETISSYALYKSDSLRTVTIPSTVTRVEPLAMGYCHTLDSVICYAETLPATGYIQHVGNDIFSASHQVKLFVPAQSVELYQADQSWNLVAAILPISANQVEVPEIILTPGTSSVAVVWPAIKDAETYELIIRDENGNTLCTLVFGSDGVLRTIAFHAPERNNAPRQTQTAGFSFTLTGLESGKTYSYTLTSKDMDGQVLDTATGSFTTQSPMGMEELNDCRQSTKMIRNGQLLILRGEKVYNAQGALVK
ncbi:MAG: leucine-rich repeat domain-containing protein [Paludibacteraceae bacterium]|nr:leucine-rich repeat domain-containing protein [Paludibacteraceae bacterium]